MFAGKKSAQIREILISESAWEEMTCLFAPSLGTLTLEAERLEDDDRSSQKQSEQWSTRISDEARKLNPKLSDYFGTRVQLSSAQLHTRFGFYNDIYASNFGLMVPSRLSASINSIKAKVYDLESLSRSSMVLKP